jgi:hypothetical protein
MVTTRSGQKPPEPKENIKLKLWRNPELKSPSGKTKKDVLRFKLPGGGYRYVWKSRHEHGKKMQKKPQVSSSFARMRIKKKR